MQLIRENKAHDGLVVLAKHQTSGKGQRGKVWKDEAGESINCSLIIQPGIHGITQHFHLVALTACALRKVIEATVRQSVQIKWPNDIYIDGKKTAGILIESITRGTDWQWAVIGFGINVNQKEFSADIPNPVSLKQISGRDYDIKRLTEDCLNFILRKLEQKSFEDIYSSYNKYLYKRDQKVSLQYNEQLINAQLTGVDETGALLLEGSSHAPFKIGEVHWIG
jgi:BirA family biotin operon repressor/biotin-[acetyl-CoA-carboxylase] ligase